MEYLRDQPVSISDDNSLWNNCHISQSLFKVTVAGAEDSYLSSDCISLRIAALVHERCIFVHTSISPKNECMDKGRNEGMYE